MAKPDPKSEKVELRPDGWERFDRAVTAAVKSGPKHRVAEKKKKPTKPLPKSPKNKSK
jgi:hypothetical protein